METNYRSYITKYSCAKLDELFNICMYTNDNNIYYTINLLPCVYTVYGISYVLSRCHSNRECDQ